MASDAVRRRRRQYKPVEHAIRNEREYAEVMQEIDGLLESPNDRVARDRVELLSILVEAYEEKHHGVPRRATPRELVEFLAEQKGIGRGQLAALLGGRSRLSDFFTGKRSLSRSQISVLRDELGIPADLLLE